MQQLIYKYTYITVNLTSIIGYKGLTAQLKMPQKPIINQGSSIITY